MYKNRIELKNNIHSNLNRMAVFINAITLTFTDLQFGRSALLCIACCVNIIICTYQYNIKIPKYLCFGAILISYLGARQAILLIGNSPAYAETASAIIFIFYTISFSLVLRKLSIDNVFLIVKYFLYINLIFGFPDYLGVGLTPLHVESNDTVRFRGLSTESNLLAIPLLILFFGLRNIKEKYAYRTCDIFICLIMIYLSFSKAAYLGLMLIWLHAAYVNSIANNNSSKFAYIISFAIVLLGMTNAANYFYTIPFYNNFIALIDFNLIASFGLNEYIASLSALDQFQSGSLGTRLATAVASIHTIFSTPYTFLFGVGGGDSYPYLTGYIFDNGLDNYELNLHRSYNPDFITDKTYILKYITEYGFIGFILLTVFFIKMVKNINADLKVDTHRILIYFIICMLLCQSPFIFSYMIISVRLMNLKQLQASKLL